MGAGLRVGMQVSVAQERVVNALALFGMLGVLLGAYVYQFVYRELPCTLCLMERVAMLGVCFGAAMNLRIGPRAAHYGLCVVAAVFGLVVSIRHTLLHINPYFDRHDGQPTLDSLANPAFGEPLFGLHLYAWGVVIFVVVLLLVGAFQLVRDERAANAQASIDETGRLRALVTVSVWAFALIASAEWLTTFLECGIGACPNDGSWDWWVTRSSR